MHPVIYDCHVHAYSHLGGTMVTVIVHDPARRTATSSALLHLNVQVPVEPHELQPEEFVRDVLIATAETL